jgi:uncharacterized surface protein with fasciclin (FAS1) repeats
MKSKLALLVALSTATSVMLVPGRAADETPKDILETAIGAGEFKTLVEALRVADLKEFLKGEGPFTVFAPTDDAFASLGSGTLNSLLANQKRLTSNFKKLTQDDGHLHAILTYHVVKGRLEWKELLALAKEGKSVETVNGAKIKLRMDGENVKVDDAIVAKTDLLASNGVIQVIDKVLLPPAPRLEGKYKRVPACPPVDESFVWQRATTPASPKSDRELLVSLWKRAATQAPPAGDKEKWAARVAEIVKLAESYAGETNQTKAADAASALVQKANCISCHAEHRPSPFSIFR